jgi:quinol monooxygenase YgiN
MIVIAGRVKIKPGLRGEALDLARQIAAQSAAEDGCVSYRFYADVDEEDTFLIFEEWRDEAALAAHFKTPHLIAFRQHLPRLLAAPPVINKYLVSASGRA